MACLKGVAESSPRARSEKRDERKKRKLAAARRGMRKEE